MGVEKGGSAGTAFGRGRAHLLRHRVAVRATRERVAVSSRGGRGVLDVALPSRLESLRPAWGQKPRSGADFSGRPWWAEDMGWLVPARDGLSL